MVYRFLGSFVFGWCGWLVGEIDFSIERLFFLFWWWDEVMPGVLVLKEMYSLVVKINGYFNLLYLKALSGKLLFIVFRSFFPLIKEF